MGGGDEEQENEDDDIDHFLLPGDDNFEDDRPTERQDIGDDQQGMSHNDVLKECNLPADDSESEDDYEVSQSGRKKKKQSKTAGRRVLYDSDDGSGGESSEGEIEFES